MIIEALVRRYEKQAEEGKIARRGWSKTEVSFGLRISENGEIADVIDLRTEVQRGKKIFLEKKEIEVPEQNGRSGKEAPSYFICDKSDYILGIDGKNKQLKTAKELHQEILANCHSSAAKAVKNFFEKWNPSEIENFPKLQKNLKDLQKGEKIIFMFGENFLSEDAEIKTAWENYKQKFTDLPLMQCLVTGEILPIARIHPKLNGVKDAQANAAIISFNANAFESYGRVGEQNLNAPISEYAAFAYTTALNDLLSDSEHRKFLGDMTVVYWAEENSSDCQDCLSEFLYPNEEISNQTLNTLIEGIKDKKIIFNGTKLNYDNPFYILGLSPNSGRISIRFFLEKNFGEIVKNISKHYEDFKLIKPTFKKFEYIPLWQILNATVSSKSKDKSASPLMSGAVVNAIMTGQNYPVSLFQNAILRIKAEHEVTYERAAIIKAYLTRNKGRENLMALNENSNDRNYVLGRIFSVFESIQSAANPGINSTIKDKYFNSACANPEHIFPILQKLSLHHLKKLDTGAKIYFDKQLTNLIDKLELTEKNSSLLTLEEQGIFILGYYHQTQERYKSKEAKENGGSD